jgi:hypothetical protein
VELSKCFSLPGPCTQCCLLERNEQDIRQQCARCVPEQKSPRWNLVIPLHDLATMNKTERSKCFSEQRTELRGMDQGNSWHYETSRSLIKYAELMEPRRLLQTLDGSLRNVVDNPTSSIDMTSTALMAATTHRLAISKNDGSWLSSANRAIKALKQTVASSGRLQNMVDPMTLHQPPPHEHTPEGQAYVLLLHAACGAVLALVN